MEIHTIQTLPLSNKHTHTRPHHLRASLTAFLDYICHPQTGSAAQSSVVVTHTASSSSLFLFPSFFFGIGADMWASRVWPPLPQLTLWPESHIISTHFTDHDMANMGRLKPQWALLPASQTRLSLCFVQTSFKVWQPLRAHPLPLSIRNSVSERLWKCSNHTWNPNICTKDTLPPEINSAGNNRASLWGKHLPLLALAHLFGPFYSKQMALLHVFLGPPQGDSFIESHLLPSVSVSWQLCVNCTRSGISRMIHVRKIHMAKAEQQPYSVGWAPGIMSNCFNSGSQTVGLALYVQAGTCPSCQSSNLNFQEMNVGRVWRMQSCHLISAYCDYLFKNSRDTLAAQHS